MKQITINGRVLGIPYVREYARECSIVHVGTMLHCRKPWDKLFHLPPGEWSILGRLNDITEEQAAGLVEKIGDGYMDYLGDFLKIGYADLSLESFFRSHGIEGNPLILLLIDKP